MPAIEGRFPVNSILGLPKLTDRYELKARLAPALISYLVAVPCVTALFSLGIPNWGLDLLAGGGVTVVVAIGLSYGSSMAGRKYEERLWPRWPYDAPTNAWLHPEDSNKSLEQKRLWYEAVKRLTGLDIGQVAVGGDNQNLERVINDAVVALRPQFRTLRQTEVGSLLAIHNEDYGFARNLAGLSWVRFIASIISAIVSWGGYFVLGTEPIWGIIAILVLFLNLWLFFSIPTYVRQRADRYAESFFGVLMALDRMNLGNGE